MSKKIETKVSSKEDDKSREMPTPPEPEPKTPQPKVESVKKESKRECPHESSPVGKHDFFFNEGTEETYCRYCGKPKK